LFLRSNERSSRETNEPETKMQTDETYIEISRASTLASARAHPIRQSAHSARSAAAELRPEIKLCRACHAARREGVALSGDKYADDCCESGEECETREHCDGLCWIFDSK
jgi:cytochrome c5